ncbi:MULTISPECIES: WYL domain-containing protein [Aliiglaciecola]|uniref:WYL domain-containing protein n=1 Tax=Aliiglaciecola TaxID=1406885 RepID=UPI001C09462C|nr:MULTISPECIES: WYL domain-containing protein [Aliiglaciecola]MBU2878737.1 WYL domain-containing protein [Aliiglaciecola lipolytica]MDO6711366.1 WYL domain-containing protein [Aliiglaciecola sp. 2_MG-2023]MDO6752185.1 WYL domain-containing protein [Aliiglaciecola sp. 1_MG-2023]
MENITDIRQERRLRYIDLCAFVLGTTNRRQLMNRFEIKEAWSTRDFKCYQEMAENNLIYNHRLRAYAPTKWFSPCFEHQIEEAIDLVSSGTQRLVCEPKFAKNVNSYRIPSVMPELKVVAPIFRALNLGIKVDINYLSRSSGESSRIIAPHTLIETGNFVYIRAFDHKSGDFRSFKLNRVVASRDSEISVEEKQTKPFDPDWNQEVEIKIGINGKPKKPEAITFDYGLESGQIVLKMRKALVFYFLSDWNIAPLEYDCLPDKLFPLKVLEITTL